MIDINSKESNPKDAIGADKLPLHLWPPAATAMGCIGLAEGATKYGRANWRAAGIRASIYYDACRRHLDAWFEGEEVAPDSGVPHLANALACLAIIVDAKAADKLIDDRNYRGDGYRALVEELTPHVARLKALHAEKAPKHWDKREGLEVGPAAQMAMGGMPALDTLRAFAPAPGKEFIVKGYPRGSLEPDPCAPVASGPIKWRDGAKWLGINADGKGMFFSQRPVFKEDDGRQVNFWKAPRGETLTWDAGYFDPEQYRRGREGLYERYVEPTAGVPGYHKPLPDGVTWADAPEWAQWFAVESDGRGFWFADQPWYDAGWVGDREEVAVFPKPKAASRTLRRRPPADSGQSELPAQD